MSRIGVDDDACAHAYGQIAPSSLEDVCEREETYDAVVLGKRHAFAVGLECCVVLSVGEHHAFAFSCGTAGVENVAEVIGVGLRPEVLHLALPRQVLAEGEEVVEVKGVRVVCAYAHAAVEDDDAFKRMAQREHAVRLVVLLLFAHEEEAHLTVVYHVLYLLFAACGVERDAAHAHAVGTEVGTEIVE